MELKQITKKVMYFDNAVNIGVIKCSESSVVLIDSGMDDDTAKKILKILSEYSLDVCAIINTHSHADHCGGNSYIKQKTNCKIYASQIEAGLIEYPLLEPTYLFCGAMPIKELQGKFLLAKPSSVDVVIGHDERYLDFEGTRLEIVPLYGHALMQIGVAFDGVLFCADSIFSKELIAKHKIPFNADILGAKKALEYLKTAEYDVFVPAHVHMISSRQSFVELAQANLDAISDVESRILSCLAQEKKSTSDIIQSLCNGFDIVLGNPGQYFLLHTTIMAYLGMLHTQGKISLDFSDNELVWHLN